jgi:transposase
MQLQVRTLDFSGQNIYAGIDTHKKSWQVSIYSDELYHKTFNQPPHPEVLHRYLCKHFPNATYYSVYEAGFCGFWIHDRLQSLGINNIVVNPADVPTTDKEKKQKTDRVDSGKLARQLRNGDLEAIYIHNREMLEDRNLVRMRRTHVKEITRYKNRIKSTLFFYGLEIPDSFTRNQSYWSNSFIKWLSKLKLHGDSGTMTLQFLIEHVKKLRKDLLEINREIRKLSQNEYYRNRVKLLMSINGIGLTTAMVILTEIDNIHRFSNQEKLAAYVGLIPTSHSSGDRDVHGEMVNRGNRFLKSAILESAWVAARVDPVLHMEYISYCRRMKKNKAIIRIARKLLNRINFVLKNQLTYNDGTEQT